MGYMDDVYAGINESQQKAVQQINARQQQTDALKKAAQIKAPKPLAMEGAPSQSAFTYSEDPSKMNVGEAYKAKTIEGPLKQYDYLRNRATEQASQQGGVAQDAIQRRFAAMGALNSGGAIKQAQLQGEASDRQKAEALQGIDFQESQARDAMNREESQKEYQSQEALKGRQFSADEGFRGRKFSAEQTAQARNYEAGQQALQRNMQRELYNADSQFKSDVTNFDSQSKLAGLDLQWQQFLEDTKNNAINAANAEHQKRNSGGLLGAGGFLGTGIGT